MGKNWAIAIGINEYENLSPLKYAKQDAEAMAAWFKQEANFDEDYVFLFTEDSPPIYQAHPPIPTEPTYGHLRRFLRAQFEEPLLNPGDNLWFFFAGHGERHRDKDYLMLCDTDPGDIEHTAISVEYVTQRLRRSGADNVVLFLDACRDEKSRSRGGLGIGEEKHQGVITFYSCTANQKSWEFDELQHGSFTHTLLEGLRLQGEANCATVERLDRYLCYQVPKLNSRYGRGVQNPYLKAEPPYKMYFILLEQSATLKDVEPLKSEAYKAELEENLPRAEQLWIRVLAVSRGDLDAIAAIQRIAVKKITERQYLTQEPVISTQESTTLPRGEGREASETEIQREKEHQQNLGQYRQSFFQAVEQEFPLSEGSRRQLRNLQQSLQLTDEEISQIEQPIFDQKEAEYQKQLAEQQRKQEEYENKLRRYEQEFIKAVQGSYPLAQYVRNGLKTFQQSLGLSDEDVERIEKPIVDQKEAEAWKRKEEERIRQQQEAERLRQQQEADRLEQQKAERIRQQQGTTIAPSTPITRKQFLKWSGLGGAALVTAVVAREIFKQQPPSISVAEPKHISPTEGAPKAFGLPLWTVEFETVMVDARGRVVKRYPNKQAKFFKEDLGNSVILEMVAIPGEKFLMGTEDEEIERLVQKFDWDYFRREKPQHEVTVQSFFMSKYPITQAQWRAIASLSKVKLDLESDPSRFKGDELPVESVSWEDAQEFCARLSNKTKREYRLPTEAEWEYACRAGTTTPFHFGETITDKLANYRATNTYANEPKGEYRKQTTPVGSFPPNAFGLSDMHGNVWEWCEDDWHDNYQGAPNDGSAWLSGTSSRKVRRGGSWVDVPVYCRSAYRGDTSRDYRFYNLGFRVVCVVLRTT